jgi:hypothetical protein
MAAFAREQDLVLSELVGEFVDVDLAAHPAAIVAK